MDTSRCVNKDTQFREEDRLNHDSDSCIFEKNIDIPVVTVNDDNIIHLIDSCLNDSYKCDYLLFPDSSGFFVELLIFDKTEDSLTLGLSITPISNYYMADILADWRNEVVYEWYGRNFKDVQGCFLYKGIVCVVTSFGSVDYDRASCLFSGTHSTIRIALFSPIVKKITQGVRPNYYYYFNECGHEHKPTELKKYD